MDTRRLFAPLLALGAAVITAFPALAADVPVAVAANFTEPAREIATAFKAATGDTAVLSFGSSGMFVTQIAQGAPFEVFLSADDERPKALEASGQAVAGTRFTYAVGRLVLFSRTPGLVDKDGAVLSSNRFQKLSIADPAAAPYGAAAIEVMRRLNLYDALKPKIVQGTSITQAYQFVDTGAAELGFVALSQTTGVSGGSQWLVPATLHAPIEQQAVLLKTGGNDPAARRFMDFLKGPQASAIIRKYGYELK